MNFPWSDGSVALLRASVVVTLAALLAAVLLWLFRVRSPGVRRFVWVAVLAQGWIVCPIVVPWEYTPAIPISPPAPSDTLDPDIAPGRLANDFLSELADTIPISTPRGSESSTWEWLELAAVVWLAGMALVFCRSAWRYCRFVFRLPPSIKAKPRWLDEAESVNREMNIAPPIPLYVTNCLGPALCRLPGGYRLLVPEQVWQQLSAAQRTAVLRHELAHYRRGDVWKSLVIRLLAWPHWFNPFAWWCVARFEQCAEWACDQQALQGRRDCAPAYARALLSLGDPETPNTALNAAASGGLLAQRVRRLLSPFELEDSLMKRILIVGSTLCLATLGVFQLRFVEAEPPETPPPAELQVPFEEIREKDMVKRGYLRPPLPTAQFDPAGAPFEYDPLTGKPNGEREAVLDIGRVFKEFSRFKQLNEALKERIKSADSGLRSRQKAITALRDAAKTETNKDRRQQLERALAELSAELQRQMAISRNEFRKEEARIYKETYEQVVAEVSRYAKTNGIRLVRRAQSVFRKDETADAKDPQAILQSLNRDIIYVDVEPVDISDEIIKRLNARAGD